MGGGTLREAAGTRARGGRGLPYTPRLHHQRARGRSKKQIFKGSLCTACALRGRALLEAIR